MRVFPLSTGRVNMRGLVLFLPVLLVLFLAGNAKTEEESSLVREADLNSNLLPAGEKVEVREAREAGKGNENEKKKKKDLGQKKKKKKKKKKKLREKKKKKKKKK